MPGSTGRWNTLPALGHRNGLAEADARVDRTVERASAEIDHHLRPAPQPRMARADGPQPKGDTPGGAKGSIPGGAEGKEIMPSPSPVQALQLCAGQEAPADLPGERAPRALRPPGGAKPIHAGGISPRGSSRR